MTPSPRHSRASGVLIVIPALNEEGSIERVIASLRSKLPDAQLLVVDDGSHDRTAHLAAQAGAHVLRLPFNLGVGGALRTGFKYARRHGFSRVVQVDADGQHDAGEIERLLAEIDRGAELAVGSRFGGTGAYEVGGVRRLAMRIMCSLVTALLGQRVTDSTSGFRAFGPKAVDLLAERYPRDYLSDTVETLLLVGYRGLVIREVPVVMHQREAGTPSARTFRLAYHYIRMLVVIAATASFSARRARNERRAVAG